MRDAQIARLAGAQFNRVSRAQLVRLGLSDNAIRHRIERGRLVVVHDGVFAIAPTLEHDCWGRWMGATLTAPGSVLSHASAAAAWGIWSVPRDVESVTRPGSGGPRRYDGLWVFRSSALDRDRTVLRGIPITTVPRTLLDLATSVSARGLARALREAVRLRVTTVDSVADALGSHRGRRGAGRLGLAVARYAGLPLERARSGAEVRALVILRDAGVTLPRLNVRIAGEEADLELAQGPADHRDRRRALSPRRGRGPPKAKCLGTRRLGGAAHTGGRRVRVSRASSCRVPGSNVRQLPA